MTGRLGYALFMLLAAGVFVLARRLIPRPPALARQTPRTRFLLAAAAFIGGSFGAKVPAVLGAGEPLSLTTWLGDGKTIMAALLGGYLAVEVVKPWLGVRGKTGDSFALPLALALAVGRWGCFVNGCCAGVATDLPWAVDFGDAVGRHPTQAYESAFHLVMAFTLYLLLRAGRLTGHHLQLYLIAYGVFRFALEGIRYEPAVGLGLTLYQWLCVVMVVGLAGQWAAEAWRAGRE